MTNMLRNGILLWTGEVADDDSGSLAPLNQTTSEDISSVQKPTSPGRLYDLMLAV